MYIIMRDNTVFNQPKLRKEFNDQYPKEPDEKLLREMLKKLNIKIEEKEEVQKQNCADILDDLLATLDEQLRIEIEGDEKE